MRTETLQQVFGPNLLKCFRDSQLSVLAERDRQPVSTKGEVVGLSFLGATEVSCTPQSEPQQPGLG